MRSFRASVDAPMAPGLLAGGVLAGAAVLVLARLAVTGPLLDRVWAEDGAVYWTDAKNAGLSAIGLTYSDYLHVFPRLVTSLGVLLPDSVFAAYVVVVVALITGVLAVLVFAAARTCGATPLWAAAAGLSLALVPRARMESIGNLANVQWLLLACLAWLSVTESFGRGTRVAAALVAAVTALSTPLAGLVMPAMLLAHGRRGTVRHPVTAPLLGGLVVQVSAIFAGSESPFVNPAVRHPELGMSVLHSLAAQILPLPSAPPVVAVLVVAFSAIGLMAAWVWTLSGARAPFLGLLLTAILLLGTLAVVNGWAPPRYWVAPTILLVGALGLWLSQRARSVQALALVGFVVVAGMGFPADPYRLSGPSWAVQEQAYGAACARGEVTVEVVWSPADWGSSRVAC